MHDYVHSHVYIKSISLSVAAAALHIIARMAITGFSPCHKKEAKKKLSIKNGKTKKKKKSNSLCIASERKKKKKGNPLRLDILFE